MSLRISKKERRKLYQKNASVRRKQKRLLSEYNVNAKFQTRKPSSFTTRAELNAYKKSQELFLKRTTHQYVRGTGTRVQYQKNKMIVSKLPIPQAEYTKIRKLVDERNRSIEKQLSKINFKSMEVKGRIIHGSSVYKQIFSVRPPKNKLNFKYSQYHKLKIDKSYFTSSSEWKKFKYGIEHFQNKKSIRERQMIMKENYEEALSNTFGKNADPLIELIDKLSIDDFMVYYESESFSDFGYIYDPNLANEVLKYLTLHMANYYNELHPTGITDTDINQALMFCDLLSEESITEEYGKGKLGGVRKIFKRRGENGRLYTVYIDLTPDEVIKVNSGLALIELNDFENRVHYIRINK